MPGLLYDAGGDIGHDLRALAEAIERAEARLTALERAAQPPVQPASDSGPEAQSPGPDGPPAGKRGKAKP